MKKYMIPAVLSLFSFLVSFTTTAQDNIKACDWVSQKGFWVVESNKKTPKTAIVYFYNNDKVLVYKEQVTNHKLKLNKKKTLYRLKAALEEAIDLSNSGTWVSQTRLVKNSLQR